MGRYFGKPDERLGVGSTVIRGTGVTPLTSQLPTTTKNFLIGKLNNYRSDLGLEPSTSGSTAAHAS